MLCYLVLFLHRTICITSCPVFIHSMAPSYDITLIYLFVINLILTILLQMMKRKIQIKQTTNAVYNCNVNTIRYSHYKQWHIQESNSGRGSGGIGGGRGGSGVGDAALRNLIFCTTFFKLAQKWGNALVEKFHSHF